MTKLASIDGRFVKSVLKLGTAETRRAWEFVDKFLNNPDRSGLNFEHIRRLNDISFYTGRISQDLRAAICEYQGELRLVHAAHHDDVYDWINSRTAHFNPRTRELQVYPVPPEEPVKVPESTFAWGLKAIESTMPVLSHCSSDYLLQLGVPEEWLPIVLQITDADVLMQTVSELPEEIQERLLMLALGDTVALPYQPKADGSGESAIKTQHIYVSQDLPMLQKLLAEPLSTWAVFLHPDQERLARGSFKGPLKVTGSAGTGKTVVALHRARHLAQQGKRVLVTSFVGTLCQSIQQQLRLLCTPQELARITVRTLHTEAARLIEQSGDKVHLIEAPEVESLLQTYYQQVTAAGESLPLSLPAVLAEWRTIIQRYGITELSEYLKVERKGRKHSLTAAEREQVWKVFRRLFNYFMQQGKLDPSGFFRQAAELLREGEVESPYDAVIVDEVQDLDRQALTFLRELAGTGADGLTLVGDEGQRIYGPGFSLTSLNIPVRGRSHTLRVNYRTTAEIRSFADRLLGREVSDMDDGQEKRQGVRSLLNGPLPYLQGFPKSDDQVAYVIREIHSCLAGGFKPEDIAIFSRSSASLHPYETALRAKGIECLWLKRQENLSELAGIRLGTMHRAKGLEFKLVFVVDVSAKQVPNQTVLEKYRDDPAEYELIQNLERQLLYVSLTRARDVCHVTWSGEPSPFLQNRI